jgi:hypothetical protein
MIIIHQSSNQGFESSIEDNLQAIEMTNEPIFKAESI